MYLYGYIPILVKEGVFMDERAKKDKQNKTTTNITLDLTKDEWREFKELLKGKTGISIGTFFSMVAKQYIKGEIGLELLQNKDLHIAKIINPVPDATKAIDSKTEAEFRVIFNSIIENLKKDGKSLDSDQLRELEIRESIKYALTFDQRMNLYYDIINAVDYEFAGSLDTRSNAGWNFRKALKKICGLKRMPYTQCDEVIDEDDTADYSWMKNL